MRFPSVVVVCCASCVGSIGTENSKCEGWRGKTDLCFGGPSNWNVGQSVRRDSAVQDFFNCFERSGHLFATDDEKLPAIFFDQFIPVGFQKPTFSIEHGASS